MTLVRRGARVEVAARDFVTNKGGLCRKGWTSAELLSAPDRLTTPLVRRGNELEPASWSEAIDRVGNTFRSLQRGYGRDSIGIFGGGGLTNEKAYMLGKFARVVLRTRNIDYNGRYCMASAAAASLRAFGIDRGLPFPLEDIPSAEVVLIVGGNPAETMPPLMQYFEQQRQRGGKLIVADPRRTPTADAAHLHLQITPGTDGALGNGLLHIAVRERWIDEGFIARRTNGFEGVRRSVAGYWPERVERITGVPQKQLHMAARLLGTARSAMVITARGAEQQSHGVDNVLAFTNLTLALGLPGKRSSGYGCLTGQGNGQGGREHGQKADQLPGYRKLSNSADRAHVAAVWGVPEDDLPPPGRAAGELFESIGTRGGLRALWVLGANPVVSAPRAGALEEQLRKLDLLVVSDAFLSETARLADVVFPVTQWAEEEGTMTNLEGRVIYRRRVLPPPSGVKSDLEVMKLLASELDRGKFIKDAPEKAFDELTRASAGGQADYGGMTYARIQANDGLFWPCPSATSLGSPRLFAERFPTPDGCARFFAVEHRPPAEIPDAEYPLYLTTGRMLVHYQSGSQTRRVPSLMAIASTPFVEIHPETALRLGIRDGEQVNVSTRRGSSTCTARCKETIRFDTLFMPFHFPGNGRANTLTNDAVDPMSKIPEFKVAAARVERADAAQAGKTPRP
jgi:assimilatory nitrate reductase catalytic subunit